MDDVITLWHVPQSRSFRVLWFLHEAGLAHRVERVDFFDKSMRGPGFLALSPAGRVPAALIDGQPMVESGAILDYLAETRAPHLGRPPGHPERRAYLEWLHYAETLGQHLANLTQQHLVLREDWMRSPTVMRLEAMRLGKALAVVGRAVAGRDWLLPGGFSAADIAVGYAALLAPRFVRDPDPALLAWCDRLRARPAHAAALAAEGPAVLYTRDFHEVPDEQPR